MGVTKRAFLSLFPRNVLNGDKIFTLKKGVGVYLDRVFLDLAKIIKESNPGTSNETLPEWAKDYALPLSIGSRGVRNTFASTGGQSLEYLQDAVSAEFPNITITETGVLTYEVSGSVLTTNDRIRLESVIDRIFPLYCSVTENIIVVSGADVARCNLGITGAAITGKAF